MTTLTIEKWNFTRTHFKDEKDLFSYVLDYMGDLETRNIKFDFKEENINQDKFLSYLEAKHG